MKYWGDYSNHFPYYHKPFFGIFYNRNILLCYNRPFFLHQGYIIMPKSPIISFLGAFCAVLIYWQLSFFVVQPIGAVPQGVTFLLLREEILILLTVPMVSVNARTGSVNLLCRGAVLGKVPQFLLYYCSLALFRNSL